MIVGSHRDQEYEGASNTRVKIASGRELRNTIRPVGWFVLPWMVMVCVSMRDALEGSLPALI